MRRAFLVALPIALLVVVVAAIVVAAASIGAQLRSVNSDTQAGFSLLGMPVLVGRRESGMIRLDFAWGAFTLLVAPFLIGIALLLWQLLRWENKSAHSF